MKYLLIVMLILFPMVTNAQNDQADPPKIAIKVPLDNSVTIKGITVKFIEVVEDSRCPKDVNCIWAGRAIVKVEVDAKGKKREEILIFGETRPGETKNQILYSTTDWMLKGLTLNPYPQAARSEGTEYVLLITEEKIK